MPVMCSWQAALALLNNGYRRQRPPSEKEAGWTTSVSSSQAYRAEHSPALLHLHQVPATALPRLGDAGDEPAACAG